VAHDLLSDGTKLKTDARLAQEQVDGHARHSHGSGLDARTEVVMFRTTRGTLIRATSALAGGMAIASCGGSDATMPAATPSKVPALAGAAPTSAPVPTAQAIAPTVSAPAAPTGPYPFKVTSATYFAAGERLEWTNKTAEEFAKAYGPKVTIDNLQVTGNFMESLISSIAAGTGPDVTRSSGAWFSDFADKGSLVDLGPYVKRDKIDMAQWYSQDEVLYRKGKQYGIPFWQAHSTYLYNKSAFAKSGVKEPNDTWTWNDLLDAAQKLNKPGETWGIQMNYVFEFAWLNFIRSSGEDYISADRSKTTINSSTNIEVMQWIVDLVQKYKIHPLPDDKTLGEGDIWVKGKVGIRLGGTGLVGSTIFGKPDFEWDMFLTPAHPKTGKRAITANENPSVVISQSKNPEASYLVAKFYGEKFAQDLLGKLRINSPSLKASASDPASWMATPPANMKVSVEQMKHAGSLSFHLNWLQWYNEITKALLPAFKSEISVKEACDKAAQIGDGLLRGA
jgi:multiple sugar transport system substrate-binding protein